MMSSEVIDILFNPWLRALLGLCLIGVVFGGAMLVVWFERKLSGDIQFRLGPKYVGPFGLFQLVADAIKLMTKEDLIPSKADRLLFVSAPIVLMGSVFLMLVAIPFGAVFVNGVEYLRSLLLVLSCMHTVPTTSIHFLVLSGTLQG